VMATMNNDTGRNKNSDGQSTSRTARSRRTQKTTARSASKKSSKGGVSSKGRSNSKYQLDSNEPTWVLKILKLFDKVINQLRSKRETNLLVEALNSLGDFQASRDGITMNGADTEKQATSTVLLTPNAQRREDAMKSWLDVCDALFNTVDVDKNWRQFIFVSPNTILNNLNVISKIGLWGKRDCANDTFLKCYTCSLFIFISIFNCTWCK
jgi:hypothetical protein